LPTPPGPTVSSLVAAAELVQELAREQVVSGMQARLGVFAEEMLVSTIARAADAVRPRTSGYLLAAAGLTAVVVGVFLFILPGMTTLLLVTLLAAYWLVSGVVKVVRSLVHRGVGWIWDACGGILAVIAGGVVLANLAAGAIISVELLFVGLALAAMASGVLQIVTGIRERSWGQGLIGVAEIVLACLLLLHPVFGLQATVWLFAIAAIGVGFTWLISGFQSA
jgi:uncharacterized membrane protein HdeD (DUF308 family)